MDMQAIDEAMVECIRFMTRVDELKYAVGMDVTEWLHKLDLDRTLPQKSSVELVQSAEYNVFAGTRVSAAVKRASMDLSRALVKLR